MLQAVLERFGRLDILVCNAGVARDELMLRLREEDFDTVINTNLKGAFLCMKAACRPMAKQRCGRIVAVSSVVGLRGNPGQTNYAASKAGLIGLGKSLAKELASRNVTVNLVAPGLIDTDMTAALPEAARAEREPPPACAPPWRMPGSLRSRWAISTHTVPPPRSTTPARPPLSKPPSALTPGAWPSAPPNP